MSNVIILLILIKIIIGVIMIKKKITQIGTSWGVIIPKAIIDGLGINPILDEVEIYLENDEIRIRKIKNINQQR